MRYYTSTGGQMSLTLAVNSSTTTLQVDNVSTLPLLTPFTLVIDRGLATEEIVSVTSVAGLTLTVIRGEDGTSAIDHTVGANVNHMLTARDLREPQEHIAATHDVHGVTGDVVGTTDTQVLTGKTIDGASNTLVVPQAQVTGLVSALAGKQATGDYATNTALTTGLAGKAATSHTHAQADVTGLVAALAGKSDTSHTHDDRYFTEAEVTSALSGKASTTHVHDDRYYTEAEIDTQMSSKAAVPPSGGRAVGDVTGANSIGLRWNGTRPVFKVDTSEFTLPIQTDTDSLNTGKANAVGDTNTAPRADGSDRPFEASSGPGTYYAVWVDADHNFFRNTSSQRYKTNIRDKGIALEDVLALRPVVFDRKDGTQTDEVGLIAEEVDAHLPWLVQRINGQVDGLRYDLLTVALISAVQQLQAQIDELRG